MIGGKEVQSITKKWIALALIISFSISILLPAEVALAIVWEKPEKVVSKLLKQSPGFEKKTKMADLAKEVNLGVPFVVNEGQKKAQNITYYTDIPMGTIAVTHDGKITYDLVRYEEVSEKEYQIKKGTDNAYFKRELTFEEKMEHIKIEKNAAKHKCQHTGQFKYEAIKESKIEEILLGANEIAVRGADQAVTKVNCFEGKNQQDWKTNLDTYNQVKMGEIYPGIELTLKATGSNVEKVFTVNPGGHPETIQIDVAGVTSLAVNEEGQLTVNTNETPIIFTAPVAYQEINGQTINVPVAYSVQGTTYGFTLGEYDQTQPLIIDPLLELPYKSAKTLNEARDSQGNVYVISCQYSKLLINKYNDDLSELLISTILDIGYVDSSSRFLLRIDSSDNIYIVGATNNESFPCTPGAYSTVFAGGRDVFVAKFNTNLELIASTFLGGKYEDYSGDLRIDSLGNVIVAGTTYGNFPTTPGAFSRTNNGGDIFIAKLNSDLTTLQSSTLFGSNGNDYLVSLVLDEQDDIYLSGYVRFNSPPDTLPVIPVTEDAYQKTWLDDDGLRKGFIAKIDATFSSLIATTLVDDRVSIALDQEGNVLAAVYPFILQKYSPDLTELLLSKGQKLPYIMIEDCG